MDVGNGDGWNGDWGGIQTWVKGLFPNLLHDLEPDEDEEDQTPPDWPHQIEIYVGSRSANVPPAASVDVSELEQDDAAEHVTLGVKDVLATQPEDRSSLVIKITATKQDEEGEEVPWPEAGNVVRSFTRTVSARPTMPRVPVPTPEPWESPGGPHPSAPVGAPPPTSAAPTPSAPNGGSLGGSLGLPVPTTPATPVPGGYPPGYPAQQPGMNGHGHAASFTSPHAPGLGDQAMLFAFQSLHSTVQLVLGEHRFLVDQNAALMDRLIGVHETSIRASAAESRSARQSLEQLNRDMLTLHKDNVKQQGETERVRLEADKRAEEKERSRVSAENAQLRETLENALEQLQEAHAAQAAAAADPSADPVRAKVAGAADQVLNAVLAHLSGQEGDGDKKKDKGNGGGREQRRSQSGGTGGGDQQQRRRRRRRPGSPGVARTGGPDPDPEPQGGAGGGGAAFDLANVDPAQAALVIKMLDPETRKQALHMLARMDRNLAIELGVQAADAVDMLDGVDIPEGK